MVTWFEISVDDMDRAKKFYETVTGKVLNKMPIPEEMGMTIYAFPRTDDGEGAAGALVKSECEAAPTKHNQPPLVRSSIYLRIQKK